MLAGNDDIDKIAGCLKTPNIFIEGMDKSIGLLQKGRVNSVLEGVEGLG